MATRAAKPQVKSVQAVIYCRISKDRGGDELGVRRQEKDGRALAERNGWSVSEVIIDNDLSASNGKRRPGYDRLLDMVRAGDVDAVICWDLDRLVRRPIELEHFFDIAIAAGMTRLATIGEQVNVTNGDGMLLARIKGAVAAEEVRKLSQRSRRKHLELAEAGKFSGGGNRPFGLSYDPQTRRMTVVPAERAKLREAAKAVLAGESMASIARRWNEAGVRTTRGNLWTGNNVRQTLESPRVAGLRSYRGEIVGDAAFPPMIDRETWERVMAKFKANGTGPGPKPTVYLLSHMAHCALCGARLSGAPVEGKRRYRCSKRPGLPGCGKLTILAEVLEEVLADMVLQALDSTALAKARSNARKAGPSDAIDEVVQVEHKLEELAEMYAADGITTREWTAARKPLEARLNSARARLAREEHNEALADLAGKGSDLRDRWGSLPFDRRKAIIEAVVDKVLIGPGVRGSNRVTRESTTQRLAEVVWRA